MGEAENNNIRVRRSIALIEAHLLTPTVAAVVLVLGRLRSRGPEHSVAGRPLDDIANRFGGDLCRDVFLFRPLKVGFGRQAQNVDASPYVGHVQSRLRPAHRLVFVFRVIVIDDLQRWRRALLLYLSVDSSVLDQTGSGASPFGTVREHGIRVLAIHLADENWTCHGVKTDGDFRRFFSADVRSGMDGAGHLSDADEPTIGRD